MKSFISNILKIIIFVMIFIFIFIVLTYLKKPKNIEIHNIAGFYGEKKNSLDMVYIGGSAAFVYWEPLEAWRNDGITSYNYASDTIQAELYKFMIIETLKYQKPKLIIIDARAYQYRDKDQPPTSVSYRNVLSGAPFSINKYNFINDNVYKNLNEKNKSSYLFDLLLYHGSEETPIIKESVLMMTGTYTNNLKGFFFIPRALRMKKAKFKTDDVTPVSLETTDILDDLLEYLKGIDTKVLFVVSPYIETKSEKANFNYVQKIIEKSGFDFLDSNEYAKEMNINYDTDFYNYNHVNIYGADKYTTFLSKYIKNKYNMPDRRSNPKYSEWNSLLPNWDSNVRDTKNQIKRIIEGKEYKNEIYIKE